MDRIQRFGGFLGMVALLTAVIAGCAEKTPEEKLAEARARYTAELNGFYVEETPLVEETMPEMAEEGEEGAGGEAAEAGDAGDEGEAETEVEVEATDVPVEQSAYLDILVKHDSMEKLPGITLDVTQVDARQNEKGHWRLWIDTSEVERANPTQYSHVLEGIDYEEGDGFSVEVRHPVPEEERSEYREYDGIGS